MEFNVPNTVRYGTTQEKNVVNVTPTSGSSDNPLNQANAVYHASTRQRVIGTGEMVKTVLKTPDSIGYAFWGYGNFSGATLSGPKAGACANNCARYLSVDGQDPLYANILANPNGVGVFPLKTAGGTYPTLSFPNVANGAYPIWTIFRLVTTNPAVDKAEVSAFVTAAQADVATFSDFIPATKLKVFRTHFLQAGVQPSNGHLCAGAGCKAGNYSTSYKVETGGDVGGQIFVIQADYDFINDSIAQGKGAKELVNLHQ